MKRIFFIFIALVFFAPLLHAQIILPPYGLPMPASWRPEIAALYRKTSKAEAEAIKPDAEDINKYANFLRQPDTGITRLAADAGCAENNKIVVAKDECLKFTMPGAGASYSFRVKDYRIPSLADLTFSNDGFQATGALVHGIMTRIGDVPLEKVNLQTKGLKFLVDFKPVTDFAEAQKIGEQLVTGINKDGFLYRRGLSALENTTYVLRSVAYDGTIRRTVNGLTYNELNFDRRRDVIVAFRIVRIDSGTGSVTILWKKLAENPAPKIKQKKNSEKED